MKNRQKFGARMAHRHTQNEENFDDYDRTPYEVKVLFLVFLGVVLSPEFGLVEILCSVHFSNVVMPLCLSLCLCSDQVFLGVLREQRMMDCVCGS